MAKWDKIVTKERMLAIGLILVVILVSYKLVISKNRVEEQLLQDVELTENTFSEMTSEELVQPEKMYVDIKGAVRLPGMYEVTSDMRVLNVIDMAGGLLEEAEENLINFSQKIEDQMVIYVPKEGEDLSKEMAIKDKPKGSSNSSSQEVDKVNINQATKEELMTLSGVGEKKAEKIIEYREENGSFTTIEDLKKVNGFGEKSFDSLKIYISI